MKKNNFKLIEVYKNHNIYNWDGVIAVNKVEDSEEHLFIVALDDSKISGNRKFVDVANTIEQAKDYINWKNKIN